MAVRAAEVLRRDPEEEGGFLRALIERCTGSYSVSEDELASRGLGRRSGLAVYDDVFFLPITGCVQEIEKLAANREARARTAAILDHQAGRSEARRVGKECVRTGRSRWSPCPSKNKKS